MTQVYTENQKVLDFVKDSAELARPDKIVWIDGSEAQIDALREEACSTGEMLRLNQEKLPGCYYHRTAENDVARVEARTFICCRDAKDAGPTNYWMDPTEAYAMLREIARGKMKGRTMYVIPYSMGVVGSPFSRIGIEVTDSIYVVLNMCIMTRVGLNCLEALGKDGDFVKGFHAKCDIDPEKRYIMHFPEDDTIISVNSGYGGNVLLGKTRQEVLRAPHRILSRQTGRLDGRAHAHFGRHLSRRHQEVCGGCIPLRLRQDQPCHAHPSQALSGARL